MKILHIHPLTVPALILCLFWEKGRIYPILYIFIFLHELSHAFMCLILKRKFNKLYLYPWGCMLSLQSLNFKDENKIQNILILLAGPIFNIIMYFFGIFPKENITLAIFNLMPVMPLDGGVILNIIFPRFSFLFTILFILVLFILCLYLKLFPILPIVLTLIFIIGEKNKTDRNLSNKIIGHFREK
ncbi:MAG: M50 family metallopeptidase [Clostridia bacterium]